MWWHQRAFWIVLHCFTSMTQTCKHYLWMSVSVLMFGTQSSAGFTANQLVSSRLMQRGFKVMAEQKKTAAHLVPKTRTEKSMLQLSSVWQHGSYSHVRVCTVKEQMLLQSMVEMLEYKNSIINFAGSPTYTYCFKIQSLRNSSFFWLSATLL